MREEDDRVEERKGGRKRWKEEVEGGGIKMGREEKEGRRGER